MIDLHTHTTYSDGTWDVKTLLKKAKENGVELLAITDHDTVKAYLELKENNYSSYFNGKIISGAEFNCVFNNAKIELLGYNFDIEKIKEAGYDVTTPVIVSNTDQYAIVEKTATGEVTKESNLIKVQ